MFNEILLNNTFPEKWKNVKVILLPKPEKDPKMPSSYRPIGLINAIGKVYETLLRDKFLSELEEKGALSEQQYGLKKSLNSPAMEKWILR